MVTVANDKYSISKLGQAFSNSLRPFKQLLQFINVHENSQPKVTTSNNSLSTQFYHICSFQLISSSWSKPKMKSTLVGADRIVGLQQGSLKLSLPFTVCYVVFKTVIALQRPSYSAGDREGVILICQASKRAVKLRYVCPVPQ